MDTFLFVGGAIIGIWLLVIIYTGLSGIGSEGTVESVNREIEKMYKRGHGLRGDTRPRKAQSRFYREETTHYRDARTGRIMQTGGGRHEVEIIPPPRVRSVQGRSVQAQPAQREAAEILRKYAPSHGIREEFAFISETRNVGEVEAKLEANGYRVEHRGHGLIYFYKK